MILADVVQLSPKASRKVPGSLQSDYKALLEEKTKIFGAIAKTTQLIDSVEKNRFLHRRIDFFNRMGTIPTSLELNKNDPLSLASQAPRIELSELRKTAEKLDFVLVPFDYVRPVAYESESDDTKNVISNFNTEMSRIGLVYTLCPVNGYDVLRHVQAKNDLPVYGNPFFQTLSTLLPIHRVTFAAINHLQKRVDQLAAKTDSLEQDFNVQMESISQEFSRRIDEIASQNRLRIADRLKTKEIKKQVNAQNANITLQQLAAQVQSFVSAIGDPLMFMVPKGTNVLSDDASCIVGPCWGPDFDDIVFTVFGLKKIPGQREAIVQEAKKWNF